MLTRGEWSVIAINFEGPAIDCRLDHLAEAGFAVARGWCACARSPTRSVTSINFGSVPAGCPSELLGEPRGFSGGKHGKSHRCVDFFLGAACGQSSARFASFVRLFFRFRRRLGRLVFVPPSLFSQKGRSPTHGNTAIFIDSQTAVPWPMPREHDVMVLRACEVLECGAKMILPARRGRSICKPRFRADRHLRVATTDQRGRFFESPEVDPWRRLDRRRRREDRCRPMVSRPPTVTAGCLDLAEGPSPFAIWASSWLNNFIGVCPSTSALESWPLSRYRRGIFSWSFLTEGL